MRAVIAGIGVGLPSRIVTNAELAQRIDTSDDWIFSHTGIRSRRIAEDSVAASDLGVEAAVQALERGGVAAEDVDLILLATSTPDFPGLPATASIVQDRLGCPKAGAMDIVAACSGFVYGLSTARAYVLSGSAQNALVIGSEIYSRILNWEDRSTCVLFGDGAGAVVVSASEEDSASDQRGILSGVLRSKGSGAHALLRKAGGSRMPQSLNGKEDNYLFMDGRAVYGFAVNAIVETVNLLLDGSGYSMDDVRHVVPHQANRRIIQAACKRGDFPEEKFFTNMDKYANTSAASIPIALNDLYTGGNLVPGDLILTVGFGAGLAYGGNLIRW